MKVKVYDFEANSLSEGISLDFIDSSIEPSKEIIYKVMHWQLAKKRAGTHSTKERGDVAGSTRKIYSQKGSGRARHGAIRGAQFRGGGIIFGPHFRDHGYKLNKKLRKLALKHAVGFKALENSVYILENITKIDTLKHSDLSVKFLSDKNNSSEKVLIVTSASYSSLLPKVRNMHQIDVIKPEGLNVYDIIAHSKMYIDSSCVEELSKRFV